MRACLVGCWLPELLAIAVSPDVTDALSLRGLSDILVMRKVPSLKRWGDVFHGPLGVQTQWPFSVYSAASIDLLLPLNCNDFLFHNFQAKTLRHLLKDIRADLFNNGFSGFLDNWVKPDGPQTAAW